MVGAVTGSKYLPIVGQNQNKAAKEALGHMALTTVRWFLLLVLLALMCCMPLLLRQQLIIANPLAFLLVGGFSDFTNVISGW
jgi:hypothetical protein